MLTLFTTAKPFRGHIGVIQRNALQSWKLLHPDAEVILFGDDAGAAEVCRELGIRHEPHVEKHESGLNYVSYLFEKAQEIARHDYLCFANCDIILMGDFMDAFQKATHWRRDFLMVGRRWETDVTALLDFTQFDWERQLTHRALTTGFHQDYTYVDFFLFRRGLYDHFPPMVITRSYWDLWAIQKVVNKKVAVIDASDAIVAVHQNHDYKYHPAGKLGTHTDPLALRNLTFAQNGKSLRGILDATYRMRRSGIISRAFNNPRWLKIRQVIAERTFGARKLLGLRRQNLERARELLRGTRSGPD